MTGDRHHQREPGDGAAEELGSVWTGLPQAEPPELIDRAVLNAARRAVEKPIRRRRWLGGLATASVMVLALAVVLQQDWKQAPTALDQRESPPLRERAASDAEPEPSGAAATMAVSGESLGEDRAEAAPAEAAPAKSEDADRLDAARNRSTSSPASKPAVEMEEKALPPELWIERLRHLRAEGNDTAFQRQLAEFRAAYPDHPLPADLVE